MGEVGSSSQDSYIFPLDSDPCKMGRWTMDHRSWTTVHSPSSLFVQLRRATSFQPSCRAKKPRAKAQVKLTQRKNVRVTHLRPQAIKPATKKHQSTAPARKPAKKRAKWTGWGLPDMEANTVLPSPVQNTILSGLLRERNAPLAKSPCCVFGGTEARSSSLPR